MEMMARLTRDGEHVSAGAARLDDVSGATTHVSRDHRTAVEDGARRAGELLREELHRAAGPRGSGSHTDADTRPSG
jgi:hypothetical protein